MRSLALFAPTFGRVNQMLQSIHRIKSTTFQETCKRRDLERCARAFTVANSIERNVTEIQSQLVDQQLTSIQRFLQNRDLSISYDYERKGFQMEPPIPGCTSVARLSKKWTVPSSGAPSTFMSSRIWKSILTSLTPRMRQLEFVKDIYRKNAENGLLDSSNPLGLPIHAAPLLFMINFKDRFIIEFYCRYGNINIRTIRLLGDGADGEEKKVKWVLSGMNIPRPVQKVVFDYCKEELLLDEPELIQLHRLSYIGGRVEEVQNLLKMYSFFTATLDP